MRMFDELEQKTYNISTTAQRKTHLALSEDMLQSKDTRLFPLRRGKPTRIQAGALVCGAEMKWCRKCDTEKPLSEFFNRKEANDGKDPWCKDCRRENNKYYTQRKSKMPKSTSDVMEALKGRGIPVLTGYMAGLSGWDLCAYGYIPIEAKSSECKITGFHGQEQYSFGFTKSQIEKYNTPEVLGSFIIFIAYSSQPRYFVVPAERISISRPKVIMTINPIRCDGLANWDFWQRYENAFWLITEKVINDAQSIKHPELEVTIKQPSLLG